MLPPFYNWSTVFLILIPFHDFQLSRERERERYHECTMLHQYMYGMVQYPKRIPEDPSWPIIQHKEPIHPIWEFTSHRYTERGINQNKETPKTARPR
ncbi:hypothetical protein BDW42DRAFT_135965 [Aspergillus taichungensis]|uniref:Uncharacterized protein n=1 Tax=Aspergillus taichungensis TaxID=482145 RepID=A0A2J5HP43_9EURO|nr:hypothetical protein BDW42DRAFT_135965 [Aspergillus taichungensis]